MWRSGGWPCQDTIEAELIAGGCLERVRDGGVGPERLRLTDLGVQVIAATVQSNRRQMDEHEALVTRVAVEMHRAGRLVWRGLSLRSPVPLPEDADRRRWVLARPDVFSLRPSNRSAGLRPVVHEIKVRRADLLSDLRRPDKRSAYLGMSSQTWYVLKAGIAQPEDIPLDCGVIVAHPVGATDGGDETAAKALRQARLELLRPAPQRPCEPDLGTWLALAKAHRETDLEDEPQTSF